MKRSRWPVVVALLAIVAALVFWFPGRAEVAPSRVLRAPVAASVGSAGGSWYCAARDVAAEAPTHTVIIASAGEEDADVRIDGFGEEGPVGSSALTVEASTTVELDVASSLGAATSSLMIEADAPVTVEHRFSSATGADQAPCSTFSADTWYFPTVVTTRDATARLSLFNPFPGDASVDIEVGVRYRGAPAHRPVGPGGGRGYHQGRRTERAGAEARAVLRHRAYAVRWNRGRVGAELRRDRRRGCEGAPSGAWDQGRVTRVVLRRRLRRSRRGGTTGRAEPQRRSGRALGAGGSLRGAGGVARAVRAQDPRPPLWSDRPGTGESRPSGRIPRDRGSSRWGASPWSQPGPSTSLPLATRRTHSVLYWLRAPRHRREPWREPGHG